MNNITEKLDKINEYAGRITSISSVLLLFVVLYEIFSRKIFDTPTTWGFELSYMLYASIFLLGGGYALKHHSHVSIDVITSSLPKRIQAIIGLVTYIIFFFLFVSVFIYVSSKFALQSWINLERSQSPWNQPLYHFKTLMPIGFLLLLIQGISEFIKILYMLKSKEE